MFANKVLVVIGMLLAILVPQLPGAGVIKLKASDDLAEKTQRRILSNWDMSSFDTCHSQCAFFMIFGVNKVGQDLSLLGKRYD